MELILFPIIPVWGDVEVELVVALMLEGIVVWFRCVNVITPIAEQAQRKSIASEAVKGQRATRAVGRVQEAGDPTDDVEVDVKVEDGE